MAPVLPSLQRIPPTASAEDILKMIERDGGIIIKNLLTADEVKRFNTEIQPEMDKLAAGKSEDFVDLGEGEHFHGINTKRLQNCVICSEVFRNEILENELMHTLCEKIFCERDRDGYWVNTAMVIEIGPGNISQPLHRDQELYPYWNLMGPKAPEAIINFMIALSPFTDENGATRIVPGSHKWEKFEDFIGHSADPDKQLITVPVEMETGDCLLFSGKLLHGGGYNRTSDQYRRGLSLSLIRMGLMGEEANAVLVPREIIETMSYRGQAMFGFRSKWPVTSGTVGAYWSHHYEELGKVLGLKDKPIRTAPS